MSRERERFDEIGKKIKRDQNDAFSKTGGGGGGRRHIQLDPPGTLNTITPCAACKLLRRRCAQECPFSPYFSPHEPQKFASVHKVFGASNVSKMLMVRLLLENHERVGIYQEVPENQRADAANSLVYEANVRLRDPIYGCMGAISSLQHQIQLLQAQLNSVRAEILNYKFNHPTNHVSNIITTTNTNNTTTNNNNNNNNNPSSSSHNDHLTFFSPSTSSVSIAAPPPPPSPPPPPPLPPPLHDLDHIDPTISSSMYTPTLPSSSRNDHDDHNHDHYSSISNENISYFD